MRRTLRLTPKRVALVVGALAVAAAALMVFIVTASGPSEENFALRGVVPLSDGTLLVIERAGMENNTYDRGRLRVVTREGREVRRSKAMKSSLVVHGVAADHVWLTSYGGGLEAWRLTDLVPAPGAKAAINGHAMLSRRRDVVGLTDDAVVVRAADDNLYTMTSSYAIAKQKKEFAYRAVAARHESVDMFPLTVEDGSHVRSPANLHDIDLVRPNAVLELEAGPGAVLVHSIDFAGVGNSAIVSRVEGAKVRWSVAARDVIGKHDLGRDAAYTYQLAELRDGLLWLAAEAAVWHQGRSDSLDRSSSRDHGEYVHQIVSVDPATGAIRANHRIQ